MDGGFDMDSDRKPSEQGALIVLYSNDLEVSEASIRAEGGIVTKSIFSFPGGRRFHFNDPSGNNLAVWTQA